MQAFVQKRKEYHAEPNITFFGVDYRKSRAELVDRFDLLISQYAGFISEACKAYLKVGGVLLVNNSHGDAGLAAVDADYELVAAVQRNRGDYRISYAALDHYFISKGSDEITKAYLYKLGRGVGYTKTAPLYIFRRVS